MAFTTKDVSPVLHNRWIIPDDKYDIDPDTGVTIEAYSGQVSLFNLELTATDDIWSKELNKERIYIAWGDGNTSVGAKAQHYYSQPGIYTLTYSIMDYSGVVHDMTPDKNIIINIQDYFGNGAMLSMSPPLSAYQGTLSPEITATMFSSWQNDGLDQYAINLYANSSKSRYISEKQYKTDRLSHFRPTWRFVKDGIDQTPLDKITITPTKLYANVTSAAGKPNGVIEITTEQSEDSILIGLSGQETLHYIDDMPGKVSLMGTLDMSKYPSPLVNAMGIKNIYNLDYNFLHQKTSSLDFEIVKNTPAKLIITSNGINGFNIGENKWENSPISFVVSMADANGNIIKTFDKLTPGPMSDGPNHLHLGLSGSGFSSTKFYQNTAVADDYPSVFVGFLIAELDGENVPNLKSAVITAATYIPPDIGDPGNTDLLGESNVFNVGTKEGVYNITKHNEDYDFAELIRSYILQDSIIGYHMFVNEFLNAVFGTDTDDPETLGKTIYEKISNFNQNISDVDTGTISSVYSMFEMIGFDIKNYRYNYPAGIKRLVDLLSINRKLLFGFENKATFNTDLGDSDNTNIGATIDFNTYTLTAGENIIAYDKFSENYTLIQTMTLSGSTGDIEQYPISAYSNDWGWPISVPEGNTADKYYNFYEYKPSTTFETINNVINFDDALTLITNNITKEDWIKKYGIVDNLFDYRLHKGFELFDNTKTGKLVGSGFSITDYPPATPSPTPSSQPPPTPTPSPSALAEPVIDFLGQSIITQQWTKNGWVEPGWLAIDGNGHDVPVSKFVKFDNSVIADVNVDDFINSITNARFLSNNTDVKLNITYSATDGLGRTVKAVRSVTFTPPKAPTIELIGTDIKQQWPYDWEEPVPGVTAIDWYGNELHNDQNWQNWITPNEPEYNEDLVDAYFRTYSQLSLGRTITYTATDAGGRESSITRTITFTQPNKPLIDIGPEQVTQEWDSNNLYTDQGATVTDWEGKPISEGPKPILNGTFTVDYDGYANVGDLNTAIGEFFDAHPRDAYTGDITFTAKDNAGRTAVKRRKIELTPPAIAPANVEFYIEPHLSTTLTRLSDPEKVTNIIFLASIKADSTGPYGKYDPYPAFAEKQNMFFEALVNKVQNIVNARGDALAGKYRIHLIRHFGDYFRAVDDKVYFMSCTIEPGGQQQDIIDALKNDKVEWVSRTGYIARYQYDVYDTPFGFDYHARHFDFWERLLLIIRTPHPSWTALTRDYALPMPIDTDTETTVLLYPDHDVSTQGNGPLYLKNSNIDIIPILLGEYMNPYDTTPSISTDPYNANQYNIFTGFFVGNYGYLKVGLLEYGYRGQGLHDDNYSQKKAIYERRKVVFVYTDPGGEYSSIMPNQSWEWGTNLDESLDMLLASIIGTQRQAALTFRIKQTNDEKLNVRIPYVDVDPTTGARTLKRNIIDVMVQQQFPADEMPGYYDDERGYVTYSDLPEAEITGYPALWDTDPTNYIELPYGWSYITVAIDYLKSDADLTEPLNGTEIFVKTTFNIENAELYTQVDNQVEVVNDKAIIPSFAVRDYPYWEGSDKDIIERAKIKNSLTCRSKPINVVDD